MFGKRGLSGRASAAAMAFIFCGLGSVFGAEPKENTGAVTAPFTLDHNRMLVEVQIQRQNGSWRPAKLWVDTGNPDFMLTEALARDLGFDLTAPPEGGAPPRRVEVCPPGGLRLGGMVLNIKDVKTVVMREPKWLFSTTHADANLPSTVLRRYNVVFDYPRRQLTLALPGAQKPRGVRVPAVINAVNGIVQLDAQVDGENISLALDNGASYSFLSVDFVTKLKARHPDWPHHEGALGAANIWGWWPDEAAWSLVRVPEFRWGTVALTGVGVVGLPGFFGDGMSLGAWYSKKTARPVEGFLGPNAFSRYRVEIDYAGGAVFFEREGELVSPDMDLVGLTLRPEPEGGYQVLGVAAESFSGEGDRVEIGDRLLQVGGLTVAGATMGTVVDALRGKPGETRLLVIERNGKRLCIEAKVQRYLP